MGTRICQLFFSQNQLASPLVVSTEEQESQELVRGSQGGTPWHGSGRRTNYLYLYLKNK